MAMTDCIFDLDDFCENGVDEKGSRFQPLFDLKGKFPKLKVTLFTIPQLCSKRFLYQASGYVWIELAVHGYTHVHNWECENWTAEHTHKVLEEVEEWSVFVKGFKAPGWQINEDVCQALAERGYWLMHHTPHKHAVGNANLSVYWTYHPWMVHGHMQDIIHSDPQYRNGLAQLIEEKGLDWDENTRFHFVSEIVNEDIRVL